MTQYVKVRGMSNLLSSHLTAFSQSGLDAETLAHLERDRWPEFERELRQRRLRKVHFDLCVWHVERPRWDWLIWRCRKWAEVEKVLNRHNVDYRWKHRGAVMLIEDGEVCRMS